MANHVQFKDKLLHIGDTISIVYRLKENDKERQQTFKGILIKIKGSTPETRMITIRKISKIGVGVEKIIPLMSPNIVSIKVDKGSSYKKSKLYFIRNLTEAETKRKIYLKK